MRMHTHHAQLYFGDSLETAPIPDLYKVPSQDVVHYVTESFTIADARELISEAIMRPFVDEKRIFVVVTHEILPEAQNALLKLFEEPPLHVEFYVVIPKNAFLLPTLLSRLSIVSATNHKVASSDTFTAFIAAPYAERINQIAIMTKEKDTQWISELLSGCEAWIEADVVHRTRELKVLMFVREHIIHKGSSSKMLLEELALCLPYKA
jgi:DNA polymerase III, delta subunit